mgnify:CR=1 FL=1
MAFERRTMERKKLSYYLPVTDAIASRPRGVMLDISLGGFRLDSREPIPNGQVDHFRLSLTKDIAPATSLVFIGRSKWCRQDHIDPSSYNIGYELINMSAENILVFQRMLEKYGARSSGKENGYDHLWK